MNLNLVIYMKNTHLGERENVTLNKYKLQRFVIKSALYTSLYSLICISVNLYSLVCHKLNLKRNYSKSVSKKSSSYEFL